MYINAHNYKKINSLIGEYLRHGVSEERLQHAALTGSVGLVLFEQLVKVSVLFTVSQHL